MKRIITLAIAMLLASALCRAAAPSEQYATRAGKAERFFSYGEWSSAQAMYTLMLHERPDSAAIWGRAIVVAGLLDEPQQQLQLLSEALNSAVPIDSLFSATLNASFRVENTGLYEKFLYSVRENEPWLARVVNLRLLDYYNFRDNGPGIVAMSEIMLAGLPDSERFLYSLARGKLLCGDTAAAIDTYTRIVSLYPRSLEALLYLGNYYSASPSTLRSGLDYLRRAYAVNPTPYLREKITSLTADAAR